MVGIVLVSHSRALVEALIQMVSQVAGAGLHIAAAGGVGPGRQDLGTDAVEVSEAILSVDGPDGVLVLMDLGSAILSAETAQDLLPPETGARVRFSPAPFLEGAIAAAVQASLGSSLETVYQEAQKSLLPKQEQLQPTSTLLAGKPVHPTVPASPMLPKAPPQEILLTLRNPHGLHARPAARFVQTAAGYQAQVRVRDQTNGRGPVSARSINSLSTLGASYGHQLAVTAEGPEAAQALAALAQLVESNFGKGEEIPMKAPQPAPEQYQPADPAALKAVPVSEGVAFGPVLHYLPPPPAVHQGPAERPEADWELLQAAIQKTRKAIEFQRAQISARLGEAQAGIFEAHLLILEDPELLLEVQKRILESGQSASAAWQESVQFLAARYRSLEDAYQQERASDVLEVGNQVLRKLAGDTISPPPHFPMAGILVAEEIGPGEIAQFDLRQVLGLVTVLGGPTSHSAILARSMGLPAVAGAPAGLLRLPESTTLAIDGANGSVWINPSIPQQADLHTRRTAWLAQRKALLETSTQPAITRDGRRIVVAANVGSLQDAEAAHHNGAEGIGLLRTEFLFLDRSTPPGEEEQVRILKEIGAALGGYPVIIRTLDIGGDKPVPYLRLAPESNPFLGVRGLRLSLRQPGLFETQLRAILRAGAGFPLSIMFPMVTQVDEFRRGRQKVEMTHLALEREGIAHAWPVETGIMVEVPSAALAAAAFAPEVDFFSIGTNDLTQYTLAAQRGSPELSSFADALHPAVLRLIQMVVEAAHRSKKWVGVCGEIAGDPTAVPALVGVGVDELSLNPFAIPRVKAAIRSFHDSEARALAVRMLEAEDATAVREMGENFILERDPRANHSS